MRLHNSWQRGSKLGTILGNAPMLLVFSVTCFIIKAKITYKFYLQLTFTVQPRLIDCDPGSLIMTKLFAALFG